MKSQRAEDPYYTAFRGTFTSLMSWKNLDDFWEVVRGHAGDGWFLYAIGEPVPAAASGADDVHRFVSEVDALLRRDHREDYCAIVYTDSKTDPTFIKIFDPNHLGVSCGYSDNPPLPGWVMSLLPPCELKDNRTLAEGRRRWWQKIWA